MNADSNGLNADELYDAAWSDDIARIDALVEAGIPIDGIGRYGFPALYGAIENTSERAMFRLLDHGASVHLYCGTDAWTPLSHAVEFAVLCVTDNVHTDVPIRAVKALCERGASPHVRAGPLGCSPMQYAQSLAAQNITREIGVTLLRIFGKFAEPL